MLDNIFPIEMISLLIKLYPILLKTITLQFKIQVPVNR